MSASFHDRCVEACALAIARVDGYAPNCESGHRRREVVIYENTPRAVAALTAFMDVLPPELRREVLRLVRQDDSG